MAYSDYTSLKTIEKEFGLKRQKIKLFQKILPTEPSPRLLLDLEDSQKIGIFTEKAKSEFLIVPILKEVWRNNQDTVALFSGIPLEVDVKGLGGYCDFILSKTPDSLELTAPIFCIVEAKNRTLEEGFAQCAAEMLGARLFNEQNQQILQTIYGTVTNGYEWCFLKLENNLVTVDEDRYALQQVEQLLGIFQLIINS